MAQVSALGCYSWRYLTGILRQHNNSNPVTKEPLAPADLFALHYSKKASGEIHDPITFKPFSEHSHIVAIATTGNVYLAESIKGGKDLLADVKYKKCVVSYSFRVQPLTVYQREDVITLQNPHGMPSLSMNATSTVAKVEEAKPVAKKPAPAGGVAAVKGKAAEPCESPNV